MTRGVDNTKLDVTSEKMSVNNVGSRSSLIKLSVKLQQCDRPFGREFRFCV